MVNGLHETFPKFRNFIFVETAAHSPSQLGLIDVPVLITNARKVVVINNVTAKLDDRDHLGPEFGQCLLHAEVKQITGTLFKVASLIQSCRILHELV